MTGNSLIDKILMGLNVVGVLGALGVFIYTGFFLEAPIPNNAQQFKELKNDTREITQIEPFKLEKITVNLYSRQTRLRFLDIQPYVLPFKPQHVDILKDNTAIFYDVIIRVAGEMSPDEINTVAGKILFESRIKKRFNDRMGKPIIKKIFFATMVVS